MKQNYLEPRALKPGFQKGLVDKVLDPVFRGECVQLTGFPGSGKTMVLQALSEGVTRNDKFLKEALRFRDSDCELVYFDLGLVVERKPAAVLKFMVGRLDGFEDGLSRVSEWTKIIDGWIKERVRLEKKVVFVMDNFECLLDRRFEKMFGVLKAIYNENRENFCFVFMVEKLMGVEEGRELPFSFGSLLLENVVFASLLSKSDGRYFTEVCAKQRGVELGEADKDKIYEMTGGLMRTMKRLVEVVARGIKLEDLFEDPSLDIKLDYHLEELWEYLADEREALKMLMEGKKIEGRSRINLENLGVVDSRGKVRMKLFLEFGRKKMELGSVAGNGVRSKDGLTKGESKVIAYLQEHENELVEKDALIEAVWGEKGFDISNHALDQLVCRVRKKIVEMGLKMKLKTVFGRGYRLEVE